MNRYVLAAILPLALVACSEPAPEPTLEPPTDTAPPAAEALAESGAARVLNLAVQELTPADIAQADLAGELACSFAPAQGAELLFLGRGDVIASAGAQGAIRLPDGVRVLGMEGAGGYDAMADGASFTAEDVSVEVALAGAGRQSDALPAAEESPALPATMTVRGGGSAIAIEGVYQCGP